MDISAFSSGLIVILGVIGQFAYYAWADWLMKATQSKRWWDPIVSTLHVIAAMGGVMFTAIWIAGLL